MKIRTLIVLAMVVSLALLASGCGASEDSEKENTSAPPPVAEKKSERAPAPERKVIPKEDTISTQSAAQAPETTPVTAAPPVTKTPATSSQMQSAWPTGKYSVQVGAFSIPDKAQLIASMARSRVQKNVYLMHDDRTGNTKVLIGDFNDKDEARRFRDQLIQQFPDYKDAWVYDVPQR